LQGEDDRPFLYREIEEALRLFLLPSTI
jgi:hypothetical protein